VSLRAASLASMIAVLGATTAPAARAQAPRCTGSDRATATRALTTGDEAIERAVRLVQRERHDEARAAYAAALEAYETMCRAGDDLALERRAIALSRLGRPLDAIESLDRYLDAHPLDAMAAADRVRVESNLRALERDVASLLLTSAPPARVTVEGAPSGTTPTPVLRFAPETRRVAVTFEAEGHRPEVREVELARGMISRLDVTLAPAGATGGAVAFSAPGGGDGAGPDAAPTPGVHRDAGLMGWGIASMVGGVVFLGVGVASTGWAIDLRSRNIGFEDLEGDEGSISCFQEGVIGLDYCDSAVSQHPTAVGLAVGAYVVSAALFATGAALLAMHGSQSGDTASIACAPSLGGIGCAGRF
jgi:hypothetical protein